MDNSCWVRNQKNPNDREEIGLLHPMAKRIDQLHSLNVRFTDIAYHDCPYTATVYTHFPGRKLNVVGYILFLPFALVWYLIRMLFTIFFTTDR